MHFIGADQLHGFEDRVTTDLYPSDLLWTTNWSLDPKGLVPWYHSMRSIINPGVAPRSVNFKTAQEASRWLYDHSESDDRPFFLTVSFTSPHDPYVASQAAWDLYDGIEIDDPKLSDIPLDQRDPHSFRLHYTTGCQLMEITHSEVRNMRRTYYSVMSLIEDQIS